MKGTFATSIAVIVIVGCIALWAQDPGAPRTPGKPGGTKFFEKKDKEPDGSRAVEGKVLDSSNALVEGAVVQLKDIKTLRIRSYITLADGTYRFSGLSAETDYELKATKQELESQTKRLTVYDERKKANIDLTLKPKG